MKEIKKKLLLKVMMDTVETVEAEIMDDRIISICSKVQGEDKL